MEAIDTALINDRMSDSHAAALAPVEYGYYFVIFYTMLGAPLGLILMGGIGSGFLMIPVLGLCLVAIGPSLLSTIWSAWIPFTCGASYLFIQLALHGESLYGMYVYQFGPWIISLVIVQALVVHRPAFLHRFAMFTLFMGLAILPFMSLRQGGVYERIGLDSEVGYANPNALAAWFGFCVVYLTIKGYGETPVVYRVASWLMAIVSMYIVTLTVSRGALLAITVSLLVASRRLLKGGLLSTFLLGGLALGLMEFGVFDQAARSYSLRVGEETGRFLVWPLLIEGFLNSPLIGTGASHAGAVTITGKFITPHNSFLFFAVASGVIPLLLFCTYCVQSGLSALRRYSSDIQDAPFYLPLVTYTVLITCAGNLDFMAPWAMVSLAVPISAPACRTLQA